MTSGAALLSISAKEANVGGLESLTKNLEASRFVSSDRTLRPIEKAGQDSKRRRWVTDAPRDLTAKVR
jgi:hypothetical protein